MTLNYIGSKSLLEFLESTMLEVFNGSSPKSLGGFPIDFKIFGTPTQQITQIGNAVPPLVVTTIVKHICKTDTQG